MKGFMSLCYFFFAGAEGSLPVSYKLLCVA